MDNEDPTRSRLWEVEHPYNNPSLASYDGHDPYDWSPWSRFYEEFGASHLDENFVFRWDWYPKGHELNGSLDSDLLCVHFMCPRKGLHWCNAVRVTPADEPEARALRAASTCSGVSRK
jgi:hypothetical protein